MIAPIQIPNILEIPRNPSPVGVQHCNNREAHNCQLIHNPSTSSNAPVDKCAFFIHSFADLSTDSVDKSRYLGITFKKLTYHVGM